MRYPITHHVARARQRLAWAVAVALLGPLVGRMPKSSIDSIERFSYREDLEKHLIEVYTVREAEIVANGMPPQYPRFLRKEAVFPRRNVYLLKDVTASPFSGMVWLEERIIEESVGSLRRLMDWGDVLHEPLLPVKPLDLPSPAMVCPPAEYYHWLLEVLPNLLYAKSLFPEMKIIVPPRIPSYVRESLAILFDARFLEENVVTAETPVRVNTLVMPQYSNEPEFTDPREIRLLKECVASKIPVDEVPAAYPGGGKLYISRVKSRRRNLAGEEVLEARLREAGFDILYCETIPFDEQIRRFRNADTIVATHGAGLSNLVWAEPPCKVIEIFPKDYAVDCFAWVASVQDFDYHYVFTRSSRALDYETVNAVMSLVGGTKGHRI
jgi:hypothetical protein